MSDLKEDILDIDEHDLGRECRQLPGLIMQTGDLCAKRRRKIAELEAEVEVLKADLDRKVRSSPEIYGIEKVTEAAIKSVILTQKNYIYKSEEIREAEYRLQLATSLLSALDAKKRSLTLLVELHGMQYFAEPRVSKEGRDAVQQNSQRDLVRRQQEKLRKRDDARD
jgi:hypothetical protein